MTGLPQETEQLLEAAAEETGTAELLAHLPEAAQSALHALRINPAAPQSLLDLSSSAVLDLITDMFRVQWQTPLRTCLQLCGVMLLTAACAALLQGKAQKGGLPAFLGSAAQCLLLLQGCAGILRDGAAAIAACAAFEKSSLPVLAVLLTLSGRPAAALSLQGAAFAAAQVLEGFAAETVVPAAAALSACAVIGAVTADERISQLAAAGRKLLLQLFTAAAGLFTGFLSLKTVIASSVDRLAVRGVRLAGSFLPLVGGAVSEAYIAAVGACAVLKNTVGAVLILVLLTLCLPVAVRLIAWSLLLRAAGSFGLLIDAPGKALPQIMADLIGTWLAVIVLSCTVCIVTAGLTLLIGGGA